MRFNICNVVTFTSEKKKTVPVSVHKDAKGIAEGKKVEFRESLEQQKLYKYLLLTGKRISMEWGEIRMLSN